MTVERKNGLKQNKTGHLKKNYKFEGVECFKYLGIILNEDNNYQIHLQERIKNANKTYFLLQKFFKSKNISKKLKLKLKNTIIDKNINICIRNLDTNRDRKQMKIFKGECIEEF
jgi:hypothetical protein